MSDDLSNRLFTVGYSNHEMPAFLRLLRAVNVTALADVRSAPYSRHCPRFNKQGLERALDEAGIAYVFLGEHLGGRPRPPELYDDEGRVDYERVRATDFFQAGLDRVVRGLERHTIALMCGEHDPLDCHRGLMITPALAERGLRPGHLRRDGGVECTDEMEKRLVAVTGVGRGELDGMFAAQMTEAERRTVLAKAYRVRAKVVAFRHGSADEDP